MEEHLSYYTAHFRRMSIKQMWHSSVGPFWLKPIIFMWFAFSRVFGKDRATFGFTRPEHLEIVDKANVPADVLRRFEPFLIACDSAGFTLNFFHVCKGIGAGSSTSYSAVFLDSAGTSFATIAGASASTGHLVLSKPQFSTESRLANGSRLITNLQTKISYLYDDVLSLLETWRLPSSTTTSAALISHQTRFADTGAKPIVLNRQSLEEFIVNDLQVALDISVKQGSVRRLTEDEVDTLLFADAEQQRAEGNQPTRFSSGQATKLIVPPRSVKNAGSAVSVRGCFYAFLFVLVAMPVIFIAQREQPPLAKLALTTPTQTILFKISQDGQFIRFRAEQQPSGFNTWRIERTVRLVDQLGMTGASIEPDLDHECVHFKFGGTRVDFDLRQLDFVAPQPKQR